MLNVENKSAVEHLAAVVAMLERREAEAREDYTKLDRHIRGDELRRFPTMNERQRNAAWRELQATSARWNEATAALSAARELTRNL